MRRLHLFEIEDLPSCPGWLRTVITQMLCVIHRWFGTADLIATQLPKLLPERGPATVLDLCSGSGGPLPAAFSQLRQESRFSDLRLHLTDLYPDLAAIDQYCGANDLAIDYSADPVDATHVTLDLGTGPVVRTMICCFHHLRPEQASAVLQDAQSRGDSMLIFEISDGRFPHPWFFWIALIPNFLFGIVVAAFTRPMTWQRFLLTFVIPVIPACFAWDGAVSHARTYGPDDFRELVGPLKRDDYQWTVETVQGRWLPHQLIVGQPASVPANRAT